MRTEDRRRRVIVYNILFFGFLWYSNDRHHRHEFELDPFTRVSVICDVHGNFGGMFALRMMDLCSWPPELSEIPRATLGKREREPSHWV